MAAGSLGRRTPETWDHVERFPLAALPRAEQTAAAVAAGINWYAEFDTPQRDPKTGRWWVARDGRLTTIRGGHCICFPADYHRDWVSWWRFYNQGREGACVGYGSSRMMSLHNRRRYYARWLWDHAKAVDEWPETNPGDDEGTSVHAALDVLRREGHVPWRDAFLGDDVVRRDARVPLPGAGVAAVRWAANAEELHTALANAAYDKLGAVPFLNSWGVSYPHIVWMPDEVVDRLASEDGELAVPTDR